MWTNRQGAQWRLVNVRHDGELADAERRTSIRRAFDAGKIKPEQTVELLGRTLQTPILNLQRWLEAACACPGAPCRGRELGKSFQ